MYQVVGRHFEPWKVAVEPVKSVLEVAVAYDRTKLTTRHPQGEGDAAVHGKSPTFQVIVDLPIPPGFNVDGGDFADWWRKRSTVQRHRPAGHPVHRRRDAGHAGNFKYPLKPSIRSRRRRRNRRL